MIYSDLQATVNRHQFISFINFTSLFCNKNKIKTVLPPNSPQWGNLMVCSELYKKATLKIVGNWVYKIKQKLYCALGFIGLEKNLTLSPLTQTLIFA